MKDKVVKIIKHILLLIVVISIISCNQKSTDKQEYKNYFTTKVDARAADYVDIIDNKNIDTHLYLSYIYGISQNVYKWVDIGKKNYYSLVALTGGFLPTKNINNSSLYEGLYTSANVTNKLNQKMIVYAPKEYFNDDGIGNVTSINYENKKNGYTAKTAPIIFSVATEDFEEVYPGLCEEQLIEKGYVYVICGVRGYNSQDEDKNIYTGKITNMVADLKSAIIALRSNNEVIPGDMDKIIAIGKKAGGNLVAILGVTGDMPEYYEYLYENGTIGVTNNGDGTYNSAFHDNIFASYVVSPTTDIENLDMENAWLWNSNSDLNINRFETELQAKLAKSYVEYINSLHLKNEKGEELNLDDERSGSYYNEILNLLTTSLNNEIEQNNFNVEKTYGIKADSFLYYNEDLKKYEFIDLASFVEDVADEKNKKRNVLGFDDINKETENRIYGQNKDKGTHFSNSVVNVLKDNYNELSKLEGFNKETVDEYIREVTDEINSEIVEEQKRKTNPVQILLEIGGYKINNPNKYLKIRNAFLDDNYMFVNSYNLYLASLNKNIKSEYELLWREKVDLIDKNFLEWIESISK